MGFKLSTDSFGSRPAIACDVCGLPIYDLWSDLATATPVVGQVVDVTIYHKTCVPPSPGSVTIPVIDFIRLYCVTTRPGDVGTFPGPGGTVERVYVEYPTGKGFEA